MNELSLKTLIDLNEQAGVVYEINNGAITQAYIEGGNCNE